MQPIEFERIVLKYMFDDETARDKILPFLNAKLFDDFSNKEIVKSVLSFEQKFNKFPSMSDLKLHITNEKVFSDLSDIINIELKEFSETSLLSEIEDFFKKKLIWSVTADIADNLKEDNIDKIAIAPESLRQALAFGFKDNVCFDIFKDTDRFYDYMHNTDKIISTGLPNLDRMIKGGLHSKTLTVFLAQTNLGKTLLKCSMAANILLQNKNVLYVTLEMSEDMIAERIYQNIFNMDNESIHSLTREKFHQKVISMQERIKNNLKIKEYPNKGANVNTIKNLLKELQIKNKFIPDVIFIDYLGIMAPVYMLKSDNSYTEGKRVAEEVRGLAVECEPPVVSSLQSNRGSFDEVITSLEAMADSIGPAATADIVCSLSQTDEMRLAGKWAGLLLKNRYGLNKMKLTFNVNYDKMMVTDGSDDSVTPPPTTHLQKINDAVVLTKTEIKKEAQNDQKKIINFE